MNKVDFENRVISVHDNLALRDDGSVIAMYEVPASIISSMDVEGKIKFKKTKLRSVDEFMEEE